MMKLCIDCKHHAVTLGPFGDEQGKYNSCSATISLVTGKREIRRCDNERASNAMGCGPDGRKWEAK